jgi:TPR repeat protein
MASGAVGFTTAQMRAVLTGPPEAAACWLQLGAERGVPEAQTRYGQVLLEGRGVPRDEKQAVYWFRQAARTDHPMAMNMLGRCYEHGWGVSASELMAVYWYRLAAVAGLDWGMYNYATMLMLGAGFAHGRKEALGWYLKAADSGHAKSINIVGGFYEDGWEVEADLGIACDCYRRAAEGGDFRGQFNYARMLADRGRSEEALCWLRRCVTTATPAFIERLADHLQRSSNEAFRAFGASLLPVPSVRAR